MQEFTLTDWMNIGLFLVNIIGWGIVVKFLNKKVEILQTEIGSLKTQIDAQKGILETTKSYFELFDLDKLKEYTKIIEEAAIRRGEIEISELKITIEQQKLKLENVGPNTFERETTIIKDELEGAKKQLFILQNETISKIIYNKYPNYARAVDAETKYSVGIPDGVMRSAWGIDVYSLVEEYINSKPDDFEYISNVEKESEMIKYVRSKSDIASAILDAQLVKDIEMREQYKYETSFKYAIGTYMQAHKDLEERAIDYIGVRKIRQQYGVR